MATVEEVFSNLSAHMIKGLMVHDQMASYYSFLNLDGYAKCHEWHYLEESKNYLCLKKHYFKEHEKIIKEQPIENPKILPSSWLNYTKQDVDINTKRNAVRDGLVKWMKWEEETKQTYEKAYIDLIAIGQINDALFVAKLVEDVSCELSKVKKYYVRKKDCDFDLSCIINEQKSKKEKYKQKIGE